MDAIAKSSPAAVQNMFVDNGDNTWTVRYYYNGTADYVTVDRYLPSSSDYSIFADVRGIYTNNGNELWMALAEKVYAQWNETGKEGRDGKNAYASIEGGWMQTVCQQVLGHASQTYWGLRDSDKQILINALVANKAVTYGTYTSTGDGLVGNHAYMISSYNSTTGKFQLYNPWGSYQPGPLTYVQLRADGQCFVVASTSGSVPIYALNQGAFATRTIVSGQSLSLSMKLLVETRIAVSDGILAQRLCHPLAIDRATIADLDMNDDEFNSMSSSSRCRTKTSTTEHDLAADAFFATYDPLIGDGCLQDADGTDREEAECFWQIDPGMTGRYLKPWIASKQCSMVLN